MNDDKPSMSAMHQRFHAIRTEPAQPDTHCTGPWFEAELLAILHRPVPAGQAREGHAQKEREIGALFARLSVPDAIALHRRLVLKQEGDALVTAFARLVEERRARLMAFLADARRRAAIAAACG